MGLPAAPLYGVKEGPNEKKSFMKGINLIDENHRLLQKIIDTYEAVDKGRQYESIGKATYARKAVGRVFEHSIQDGLNLAEALHLDPSALVHIIARPEFIVKHQKFCQEIAKRVRDEYARYRFSGYEIPWAIKTLYQLFEGHSHEGKIFKGMYDVSWRSNAPPFPVLDKNKIISWNDIESATLPGWPKVQIDSNDQTIKEIDGHYSAFLEAKRFKSDNDPFPILEERAKEHLKTIELVSRGAYYGGEIRALFLESAPDELAQRRVKNYFGKLPHQDLLTYDEIQAAARKLKVDLAPLEEKIKKARYFLSREVYTIERRFLLDLLLTELKKMLKARLGDDTEVVQDNTTGIYKIINHQNVDEVFTTEEESLLELLNCIENPRSEAIHEYFIKENDKRRAIHKTVGQRVWQIFGELLGSSESFRDALLKTVPAKRDRNLDALVNRFLSLVEPDAFEDYGAGRGKFEDDRDIVPEFSPKTCLIADNTDEFLGGGEKMLNDTREVFRVDTEIEGLVVTKILGAYNPETKQWEKTFFPVSHQRGETENIEFTIANPPPAKQVSLPRPMYGYFDKSTTPSNCRENSMGEMVVTTKGKEEIIYEVACPVNPAEMKEISGRKYETFKAGFVRDYGNVHGTKLAELPEEVEIFLRSIDSLNPAEKIMRIEEFARSISHYDLKNEEVIPAKVNASVAERLAIMEDRLAGLRSDDTTGVLVNKKYAGVCADFAVLTVTMLRKAGFLAGMAGGFASQGKSFQMKHHHAAAYVIWPNEAGIALYTVDGTPAISDSRAMESEQLTLRERRKIAKQKKQKALKDLDEKLEKSFGKMVDLDTDELDSEIDDEELRKLLKKLSTLGLDEDHVGIIKSQLDLYLYSPIHTLNVTDPADRVKLMEQMAAIAKGTIKQDNDTEETTGDRLYRFIQEFLKHIFSSNFVRSKKEARILLKSIMDSTEQLQPVEKKAVSLIVKNFFQKLDLR